MRRLGLVAVMVFAGCGSSDEPGATANGVFPAAGFTGRALRVEVSGDNTNWKDDAAVTFGAGVTVKAVTVSSPTDLFADIEIDSAAALGLQDVTVTEGNQVLTLTQAFELKAPVSLDFQGDIAQGGLPIFTINNLDFDNQFDLTTDADGNFANITLSGPNGTDFSISAATAFSITGRVFINGDASGGPVTVASGPAGSQVTSAFAKDMDITARTPTPLAADTATTGMIAAAGDSVLYSVDAPSGGPAIVHFTLATQGASTASEVLPDPVDWNQGLGGSHAFLASGGKVDVIVADTSSDAGYSFQITGAGETVTTVAENDTTNATFAGGPLASAIPFGQTANALSSAADIDFIRFTVTAADAAAGKRVHVITDVGADLATDTSVDVVDAAANSFVNDFNGGPGPVDGSECTFFGFCLAGDSLAEDLVSDVLPAGTYAIKITAGPGFATTDKNYGVVFWLE